MSNKDPCHLQVLGSGVTSDVSSSFLISFANAMFLFNVGEGSQRMFLEHKIRMRHLQHVCLTRLVPDNVMGLPGMLLTMADVDEKRINVHGPIGTRDMITSFTAFSHPDILPSKVYDIEDSDGFITPYMEVFGIPAVPEAASCGGEPPTKKKRFTSEGMVESEAASSDANEGPASPLVDTAASGKPDEPDQCIAVSYVLQLPPTPGKFDARMANVIGVPKGPLRGKLVKGESITLSNGRVVTAEEVIGPATPGPAIVVLDCPTLGHLRLVESSSKMAEYLDGNSDGLECVVHLSPEDVIETMEYATFSSRFRSGSALAVNHLYIGSHRHASARVVQGEQQVDAPHGSLSHVVFPSAVQQLARLHRVDPNIFPLVAAFGCTLDKSIPPPFPLIAPLTKHIFRPTKLRGPNTEGALLYSPPWPPSDYDEVAKVDVPDAISDAREPPESLRRLAEGDVELVFLGTGAAMPSKYRNVTSQYLRIRGKGGLLMDAGENVYGQLVARFGSQSHAGGNATYPGIEEILREMRCVWISHMHADHHLGLVRLLHKRSELSARLRKGGSDPVPPLLIIGPERLRDWLRHWKNHCHFEYNLLPNVMFESEAARDSASVDDDELAPAEFDGNKSTSTESSVMEDGLDGEWGTESASATYSCTSLPAALVDLGLNHFETVPVIHCRNAYGLVFSSTQGWKFVFSGDTRPCPALVRAGKGALVCVHEATFEDGLQDEAIAKDHATTGEAVQSGAEMGAYRTILTHFSQRYPKIPKIDDSYSSSTAIAFDWLTVDFARDLRRLPSLLPAISRLFPDEFEEGEDEFKASAANALISFSRTRVTKA
eukprot:Rmarinus@m.29569